MSRRQSGNALLVVLIVIVAAVGGVTTWRKATNPTVSPLAAASNAASSALYCTGFPRAAAAGDDRVVFFNTSARSRTIDLTTVASNGSTTSNVLTLATHQSGSFEVPTSKAATSYAVDAEIDGGGVIANEVANGAIAPCDARGVTAWYATGFSTQVGSSAEVSLYNPTSTPAVVNVSAYSAAGFSAPAPFQGLTVNGHTQVALDLGTALVNVPDVGVHVNVLRGVLCVVGVQSAGATTSFNIGSATPANAAVLPLVTTSEGAYAAVDVANPTDQPANVTLNVALGAYQVPAQTTTVAPYQTGQIVLTPNPAIAPAGYAHVTLRSNVAVVSALATGSSPAKGGPADVSLSAAPVASSTTYLSDATGQGFDEVSLTNTDGHPIQVSLVPLDTDASAATAPTLATITLGAYATTDVAHAWANFPGFLNATYLLSASRPSLLVAATLPSRPRGSVVVNVLHGR